MSRTSSGFSASSSTLTLASRATAMAMGTLFSILMSCRPLRIPSSFLAKTRCSGKSVMTCWFVKSSIGSLFIRLMNESFIPSIAVFAAGVIERFTQAQIPVKKSATTATGTQMRHILRPAIRIETNSLSAERRPKVRRIAVRNENGIARLSEIGMTRTMNLRTKPRLMSGRFASSRRISLKTFPSTRIMIMTTTA